MSELADEMARHMEPEHLKAIAAEKVSDLKEQAKERATEKVDELKTHAKEAVMRRTTEIKYRADTSKGWSLLGAIIGAGVGSMLMRKAFDVRRESRWGKGLQGRRMYDDYDRDTPALVPSPDGGLMRPTGDVRGAMGSDLGVRTSMDVGMGDSNLKARASDWFDTVSDNPVLLAIGGLAIGALFASFIPVTNRERQLIEPAKTKVKERLSELGDQLESKLSGLSEDTSDSEDEYQSSAAAESERERGTIPPLPPLDDYTSIH